MCRVVYQVAGLVVQEVSPTYSHWNAHFSIQEWLRGEGIPAIEGIDTRAVTKKIRSGTHPSTTTTTTTVK